MNDLRVLPAGIDNPFEYLRQTAIALDPQTGCWNWTRSVGSPGYGDLFFNGRHVTAHRLFAHLAFGFDLDSSLCVLHRCDNRRCCNPEHLFIGTRGDNMRDCVAKGRYRNQGTGLTHCPHGHPYSGANLYVTAKGYRQCVACKRQQTRDWRKRNGGRRTQGSQQ